NDAPTDGSAWIDNNNRSRLLRGGSWNYVPRYCYCAYRIRDERVSKYVNVGFRVVVPLVNLK
ncbi:MAG: SUMF1/EgtB/PvdO family nonheme iron enzyme, partial [Cyanobacteria bacterium P01_C01_bin.38]